MYQNITLTPIGVYKSYVSIEEDRKDFSNDDIKINVSFRPENIPFKVNI